MRIDITDAATGTFLLEDETTGQFIDRIIVWGHKTIVTGLVADSTLTGDTNTDNLPEHRKQPVWESGVMKLYADPRAVLTRYLQAGQADIVAGTVYQIGTKKKCVIYDGDPPQSSWTNIGATAVADSECLPSYIATDSGVDFGVGVSYPNTVFKVDSAESHAVRIFTTHAGLIIARVCWMEL